MTCGSIGPGLRIWLITLGADVTTVPTIRFARNRSPQPEFVKHSARWCGSGRGGRSCRSCHYGCVPNGSSETIKNHASFIWSVADLLRGDYKQSEYGKVVLPLTVLRRFDCVLAPVKQDMLDTYEKLKGKVENFGPVLDALTSVDGLWNTSRFDLPKLLDDPDHIADNLRAYIHGFSPEAQEILDRFEFAGQITRLHKAGLLYLVLGKFAEIDLHPDRVSNLEMGYLYEELIRRFSELSNETAGEHFTPREVIRLMVNLLFIEDDDILSKPGAKATLYDPACGTGGMLSVAEDFVRSHNPQATLTVYGQELNSESYAICRSDMMLKGQNASNIKVGNSLKSYDSEDPGDQAGARSTRGLRSRHRVRRPEVHIVGTSRRV